ncbi:SRPBCC family protein [Amnibacterium kyonggiense]|uniref:Uncharacterized protein YndB with AHSA1/START domain n=1 Tax=Amnibacterium kyonggiense TaxID=595671 RepID=A0A4R7FKC3_9MICO|nr:SRPBCC family protein [Amnibacterium kyonggiense]TDS76795.1 uncharacterized protein YndB with AHSA1/START domain [Amnibacterium kyonggiense]
MTHQAHTVVEQDGDRVLVRVDDVFATSVDDLWSAITEPARLARWVAEVSGDLREGGALRLRFTSGWEGTGRVLVCDAPRRLVVANREDDGEETVVEARIEAVDGGARLTVEERGLPADGGAPYAAGWSVHLEDLALVLDGHERGDFLLRLRARLVDAQQQDGSEERPRA